MKEECLSLALLEVRTGHVDLNCINRGYAGRKHSVLLPQNRFEERKQQDKKTFQQRGGSTSPNLFRINNLRVKKDLELWLKTPNANVSVLENRQPSFFSP